MGCFLNSTEGLDPEVDPVGEVFFEFPADLDSFLSVSGLAGGDDDARAPPNTMGLDDDVLGITTWLLDQTPTTQKKPDRLEL